MSLVRLKDVSVLIPVHDSHSLRLIRVPSFGKAKVGTRSVDYSGNVVVMHALTGLNLNLSEGDRVCLIGHNGAGKTTLLRVIAGIYPPSSGEVETVGTLFSLLGNSMVLNSDATGYENIQLVSNLFHWPKQKMSDFVRDIEEFTELGEYLSLPVRIYSAGMQARLAFGMATTQSPDILLIDEGIGLSDAQFQEKAKRRIEQFINRARIIVMASHSVELCRAICNKALLMSAGQQVFFGDVEEAFARYPVKPAGAARA
jgi:ABC-2 type transport system ATP-binding protein/lipopolysaccharide transport system ATP-binding protein